MLSSRSDSASSSRKLVTKISGVAFFRRASNRAAGKRTACRSIRAMVSSVSRSPPTSRTIGGLSGLAWFRPLLRLKEIFGSTRTQGWMCSRHGSSCVAPLALLATLANGDNREPSQKRTKWRHERQCIRQEAHRPLRVMPTPRRRRARKPKKKLSQIDPALRF